MLCPLMIWCTWRTMSQPAQAVSAGRGHEGAVYQVSIPFWACVQLAQIYYLQQWIRRTLQIDALFRLIAASIFAAKLHPKCHCRPTDKSLS